MYAHPPLLSHPLQPRNLFSPLVVSGRVLAAHGAVNGGHQVAEAQALLVAARVGDACVGPDAVGAVNAGAGNEALLAVELEVVVVRVVDTPALELAVLRGVLLADGVVADLALAYD